MESFKLGAKHLWKSSICGDVTEGISHPCHVSNNNPHRGSFFSPTSHPFQQHAKTQQFLPQAAVNAGLNVCKKKSCKWVKCQTFTPQWFGGNFICHNLLLANKLRLKSDTPGDEEFLELCRGLSRLNHPLLSISPPMPQICLPRDKVCRVPVGGFLAILSRFPTFSFKTAIKELSLPHWSFSEGSSSSHVI